MQGPLPLPRPLLRTHRDETQVVFALHFFQRQRRVIPHDSCSQSILFLFLNQEVTFLARLGTFSSDWRSQVSGSIKVSGNFFILFIQGSFTRGHLLLFSRALFHIHTWYNPVQQQSSTTGALQKVPCSGTPWR